MVNKILIFLELNPSTAATLLLKTIFLLSILLNSATSKCVTLAPTLRTNS
ncbi:hypothetical protein X975_08145, partial [Stegodyphus mimosarum]